MQITIWDLDYFYKLTSIPNVDCMRLSSYHKQQGDAVNFISDETQLNFTYDKMYIVKELERTPLPQRKYLDDTKVELVGKGFKYYKSKQINSIVAACRPDYLLYEHDARNPYSNANFITFYASNKLIKTRQDFHNTFNYHKKTVITDDYFWKAPDEEIIWCLEYLKNEKNVAFLKPISLKKILSNTIIRQKFLALNFTKGTIFKWRNDWSSQVNQIQPIIDFLLELKSRTHSDIGVIPIKAIDGTKQLNLEFLRCLRIVYLFKTNKLKCIIIANQCNIKLFQTLEIWTRYNLHLSYIEFVTHNICLKAGTLWYNILNHPIEWQNEILDYLVYFLSSTSWTNYRYLFFAQWGEDELPQNKVNYDAIKQNLSKLYGETDE